MMMFAAWPQGLASSKAIVGCHHCRPDQMLSLSCMRTTGKRLRAPPQAPHRSQHEQCKSAQACHPLVPHQGPETRLRPDWHRGAGSVLPSKQSGQTLSLPSAQARMSVMSPVAAPPDTRGLGGAAGPGPCRPCRLAAPGCRCPHRSRRAGCAWGGSRLQLCTGPACLPGQGPLSRAALCRVQPASVRKQAPVATPQPHSCRCRAPCSCQASMRWACSPLRLSRAVRSRVLMMSRHAPDAECLNLGGRPSKYVATLQPCLPPSIMISSNTAALCPACGTCLLGCPCR